MNLQQLKYFRETIRHGLNLTAAALAVHTSQPGLSKAIRELEDELGAPLFVRHGKKLTKLTPEGEQVAIICERLLNEADNLKRASLAWRGGDEGELRIAATHTQARYSLPQAIVALRAQYPKVSIRIQQATPQQIVQMLKDEQVDLGLATEALSQEPSLQAQRLFDWKHVAIAPVGHAVATQCEPNGQLSLAALAQYDVITYERGIAGRAKLDDAFTQLSIAPRVVLQAIDSDVIKTYVQLGLGVGIVSELATRPQAGRVANQELDALCVFEIVPALPLNTTYVAYKKAKQLRRFEQALILALQGASF